MNIRFPLIGYMWDFYGGQLIVETAQIKTLDQHGAGKSDNKTYKKVCRS